MPQHLEELTSIRALAAFSVVIFHIMLPIPVGSGFIGNLVSDGHLGVDLFFMLSGFILTKVYLLSWEDGTFDYRQFLVNRVARIYPLHLFMLLAFVVAFQFDAILKARLVREGANWSELYWQIFLMHSWGITDRLSWNFPSWSVSAEAFAYLLLPLTFLLSTRLSLSLRLLFAFSVFLLASFWVEKTIGRPITKLTYDFGIIRVVTEFWMGHVIYCVVVQKKMRDSLIRPCAVLCAICVILLSGFQSDERLIVLALAALLASLAYLSLQDRKNFLRHPTLVYLGEISYATYMVHVLAIMVVRAFAPEFGVTDTLLMSLIILVGTYSLSPLLFHLIERPSRGFIRIVLV